MDSTTSQCLDRRAWEELPSLPPYCPVPMPKDREAATGLRPVACGKRLGGLRPRGWGKRPAACGGGLREAVAKGDLRDAEAENRD